MAKWQVGVVVIRHAERDGIVQEQYGDQVITSCKLESVAAGIAANIVEAYACAGFPITRPYGPSANAWQVGPDGMRIAFVSVQKA